MRAPTYKAILGRLALSPRVQGWIECVGCADRSCYDLEAHERATHKGLYAFERLPAPVTIEELVLEPAMGQIAKEFRQKTQAIKERLGAFSQAELKELQAQLSQPYVAIRWWMVFSMGTEASAGENRASAGAPAPCRTVTVQVNGEAISLNSSWLKIKTVKKQKDGREAPRTLADLLDTLPRCP